MLAVRWKSSFSKWLVQQLGEKSSRKIVVRRKVRQPPRRTSREIAIFAGEPQGLTFASMAFFIDARDNVHRGKCP